MMSTNLACRLKPALPGGSLHFDVLVIGGGHAGIEAAAAAARLGARTALVTGNLDTIGKMSCNPSIGGMAKGQLAREVDALGGLMGRATDATGIQFRMLGLSKGPALWSPRAQCDKTAYAAWMKQAVEDTPNLFPLQGEAWELLAEAGAMAGVRLRDGRVLHAPQVVVTTGTFLQGLLHQGETQTAGGRMGDAPAQGLSAALRGFGLHLIRHKTGTPCRIHGATVRWELCEEQPGDEPAPRFSFTGPGPQGPQISCWSCRTTDSAHAVIRANLHRAPMYNGQISSVGPRYCPSIEDKVTRFAGRDSHHLYLEPEGRATREIYVNGLSTSLPLDVQAAVLAAIPALADAHVLRYGYAVEYDVLAPNQIDHRLAVRSVPGLFCAGQINGTSGYEEAAAQGLIAGANAALAAAGRPGFTLSRADAYLGVLVDDLVTRQPDEPYRMFTSRAEHRLHLRGDNADRRLTPLAARFGLVASSEAARLEQYEADIAVLLAAVPEAAARHIAGEALDLPATTALLPRFASAAPAVQEQAWIALRYHTYLDRQQGRIERLQRHRDLALPADLDLATCPGISNEGRQKLARFRPATLGACHSIPGVSQADVETIWALLQARL
jgi:tRNA uridine 5-carboxymethylaminomethyl modification enzyme